MSEPQAMVIMPNDLVDIENTSENVNQTNNPVSNNNNSSRFPRRPASDSPINRLIRILKITIALAKNNSFDDNLKIRKPDGTVNENSNLANLLNLTQTKVRTNPGIDDFIHQLIKSFVSPDLIINEIIKTRVQLNEIKNVEKTDASSGFDLIQNQDATTSTENVNKNDASTDYDIIHKQYVSTSTETEKLDKKDFSTNTDSPILKML